MTLKDIKAICICKLRTRCECNASQNAEHMDTGDEGNGRSSKASASRRYTRKLRVSYFNLDWPNSDRSTKKTYRLISITNGLLTTIAPVIRPFGMMQKSSC